jgi:hypothetical protein
MRSIDRAPETRDASAASASPALLARLAIATTGRSFIVEEEARARVANLWPRL